MKVFKTESGSIYQIEECVNKIKRVRGSAPSTARQGDDWREYESITELVVGQPLIITWKANTPLLDGSPSYATPATLTSTIVEICNDSSESN